MGRYKLIENADKFWELFQKYKKWTNNNPILIEDYVGKDADRVLREKPRCLTIEGFENFVADLPEMPCDLGDYFENRNGAYKDFSAICSRVKKNIRQNQIEGGMAGIFNPSITQRLNSLVEKQETKHEITKFEFGDD